MLTKTMFYLYLTLNTFSNCCDCNVKNKNPNKTTDMTTRKSYPLFEDQSLTEPTMDKMDNTPENVEETTKTIKLNETHFELNEDEFRTNSTEDGNNEVCENFKNGYSFDFNKMADVWQVAYYRMAEKLSCFKIHIKKTTVEDRKYYAQKYGNLNDSIDWEKCLLEIRSSEKAYSLNRKHFLQGNNNDQGVMENIIIQEEADRGNTKLTLHDASADQWLVIKNLLLMGDCDNRDVIVFSRIPHQPRLKDISEALSTFGEESINGTLTCTDDEKIGRSNKYVLRDVLVN